jgi:hypothetical protein
MYIILVFKVFVPISLGPWAVPDGPQGSSASLSDPLYGDKNVPFYPCINTARTTGLSPHRAGRTLLKSSSKVLVLWSIEMKARSSTYFLYKHQHPFITSKPPIKIPLAFYQTFKSNHAHPPNVVLHILTRTLWPYFYIPGLCLSILTFTSAIRFMRASDTIGWNIYITNLPVFMVIAAEFEGAWRLCLSGVCSRTCVLRIWMRRRRGGGRWILR